MPLDTDEAEAWVKDGSDMMSMMVLAKSSDTATTKVYIAHDVGEVWASMLWEVYWNLVTKHGFSSNLARNAILDADVNHYKGAHRCEIYKGFAKRGLGLGATDSYIMTFRFHLNVSSDSTPVSYDDITTAY
ncbi:hypothetical protein BASA60_007134 [Batrachochytrium salamandrivorans]|nr:hypothetical protein BASA60_007134 [Batrachochytrium salamandrivorans]